MYRQFIIITQNGMFSIHSQHFAVVDSYRSHLKIEPRGDLGAQALLQKLIHFLSC